MNAYLWALIGLGVGTVLWTVREPLGDLLRDVAEGFLFAAHNPDDCDVCADNKDWTVER